MYIYIYIIGIYIYILYIMYIYMLFIINYYPTTISSKTPEANSRCLAPRTEPMHRTCMTWIPTIDAPFKRDHRMQVLSH